LHTASARGRGAAPLSPVVVLKIKIKLEDLLLEKFYFSINDNELGTFLTISVVQPDLNSLGLQNILGWSNPDMEPDATFDIRKETVHTSLGQSILT
jgi:hypothetical protein